MSRSTVVPAQVMTVEDKIIGSLGMRQMILLGIGVIGSGSLFLMLAPTNKLSAFKLAAIVLLNTFATCGAIRYKGELLLQWAVIWLGYTLRPRYWIFDKNTTYLRQIEPARATAQAVTSTQETETPQAIPIPAVDIKAQVQLNEFLSNPGRRVRFVNTRGGMKIVYTAETE